MTTNKKAGRVATRPASNIAFTERNSTAPDPLRGWFNLAKPSAQSPAKERMEARP